MRLRYEEKLKNHTRIYSPSCARNRGWSKFMSILVWFCFRNRTRIHPRIGVRIDVDALNFP
jgi:hypothetical protein